MKLRREPVDVVAKNEYRKDLLGRLGFDPDQYPVWKIKFANVAGSAKKRGIGCHLSFHDYLTLAKRMQLFDPARIGRSRGQYQLARKGDVGDYVLGNCRFVTMEQNQQERKLNGGTAVAVEKTAEHRRGLTKETSASVRASADKLRGRTAETHAYLAAAGLKRGRAYRLVSPEGVVYVGKGLNSFCKEHGLSQVSMQQLCTGKFSQLKGWTGGYTD